jgi:hypothetical protein
MARKKDKEFQYNKAEILVCRHKFGIDEEHQMAIRQKYRGYTKLLQLARDVFEDETLDEHSPQVIGTKNLITRLYKGTEVHNFSDDQITFISENGETMTPMEITRNLFPNGTGTLLPECKSVVALLRAFGLERKDEVPQTGNLGPYSPPTQDAKILQLINVADKNANYHMSKLDSEKRRRIGSLKNNLSSARFISTMSAIRRQDLRNVFETEYVRAIYDKPDLTPEENNGYVSLAQEYVLSISIQEEMGMLKDAMATALEDEDGPKVSKSLADALSAKIREYNDCQERMIQLHDRLDGKRSDRLKLQGIAKESLAKWIEMCRTEEGRQYLLKLDAIKTSQIEQEIKRIDSLEDLVGMIDGISVDEILKYDY